MFATAAVIGSVMPNTPDSSFPIIYFIDYTIPLLRTSVLKVLRLEDPRMNKIT